MSSENLNYQADGVTMSGQIYWNDKISGPRPGVLVFPEGLGLSEHTRNIAKRLAEQGYVALACDYYGGGLASQTGTFEAAVKEQLELIGGSNARIRARGRGAYDALAARPEVDKSKIAAIGYCFGGTMAAELAFAATPLAAAVGFHSGISALTTADAKNIHGRLLLCLGADDPWVPPEHRTKFEAEMRQSGVKWQLNLYGGVVHSFTNPAAGKLGNSAAARYDAWADEDSWNSMLRLFQEVLA
jgi:dienelactone hydrolase